MRLSPGAREYITNGIAKKFAELVQHKFQPERGEFGRRQLATGEPKEPVDHLAEAVQEFVDMPPGTADPGLQRVAQNALNSHQSGQSTSGGGNPEMQLFDALMAVQEAGGPGHDIATKALEQHDVYLDEELASYEAGQGTAAEQADDAESQQAPAQEEERPDGPPQSEGAENALTSAVVELHENPDDGTLGQQLYEAMEDYANERGLVLEPGPEGGVTPTTAPEAHLLEAALNYAENPGDQGAYDTVEEHDAKVAAYRAGDYSVEEEYTQEAQAGAPSAEDQADIEKALEMSPVGPEWSDEEAKAYLERAEMELERDKDMATSDQPEDREDYATQVEDYKATRQQAGLDPEGEPGDRTPAGGKGQAEDQPSGKRKRCETGTHKDPKTGQCKPIQGLREYITHGIQMRFAEMVKKNLVTHKFSLADNFDLVTLIQAHAEFASEEIDKPHAEVQIDGSATEKALESALEGLDADDPRRGPIEDFINEPHEEGVVSDALGAVGLDPDTGQILPNFPPPPQDPADAALAEGLLALVKDPDTDSYGAEVGASALMSGDPEKMVGALETVLDDDVGSDWNPAVQEMARGILGEYEAAGGQGQAQGEPKKKSSRCEKGTRKDPKTGQCKPHHGRDASSVLLRDALAHHLQEKFTERLQAIIK